MAERIDFNINFKSSGSKEVITAFNQLNAVMDKVETQSSRTGAVFGGESTEASQLTSALNVLNKGFKDFSDSLKKSSKELNAVLDGLKNNDNQTKNNIKTYETLKTVTNKAAGANGILATTTATLGEVDGKLTSVVTTKLQTDEQEIKKTWEKIVATGKLSEETKRLVEEQLKLAEKGNQQTWPEKLKGWIDELNKKFNTLRWSLVNIFFVFSSGKTIFDFFTKAGIELGFSIARISSITQQSASEIVNGLEDARRRSIFNLQEMSNAFTEFVKLGFTGQEALKAMPAVADLATAGFTDLATATRITGQVMQQFDIDVGDVNDVVDLLARGANMSAAEVESFGAALSYAGGVASIAGISLEETAASIAILTNAGMSGSRAGTALASALQQMTNPSNQVKETLEDIGVSFFDASGNMKNLDSIIRDLSNSLSRFSSQSQLQFLNEAFGARGGRAIFTLINQYRLTGDSISDVIDEMNGMADAQALSNRALETGSGRLKRFGADAKSSMQNASRAVAEFLGKLLLVIDGLKDSENAMKAFKNESRQGDVTWYNLPTEKKIIEDMKATRADVEALGEDFGKRYVAAIARVMERDGSAAVTDLLDDIKDAQDRALKDTRRQNLNAFDRATSGFFTEGPAPLIPNTRELGNIMKSGGSFYSTIINGLSDAEKSTIAYEVVLKALGAEFESTENKLSDLDSQMAILKQTFGDTEEYKALDLEFQALKKRLEEIKEEAKYSSVDSTVISALDKDIESFFDKTGKAGERLTLDKNLKAAFKEYTKAVLGEQRYALYEINEEYRELLKLVGKTGTDGVKFTLEHARAIREAWMEAEKLNTVLDAMDEPVSRFKAAIGAAMDIAKQKADAAAKRIKQLEDNISDMLSRPFAGQLGAEREMFELDQQIKLQRLEILKMGDSAEETTDKLKKTQDEYKAWVDTIKQFIRAALTEGRDLGKDVTDIVNKFQTKLLGITTFDTESEKAQTEEEKRLEELQRQYQILQLQYETSFGRMRGELDMWTQEHELSGKTLYSSVDEVTNAVLRQEQKIESAKKKYDEWNEKLSGLEKDMRDIDNLILAITLGMDPMELAGKDAFDNLKTYADATAKSIKDVYNEMLNITSLSPRRSRARAVQAKVSGGVPLEGAAEIGIRQITGMDYSDVIRMISENGKRMNEAGDFVMRPNAPPLKIDPNDTLVGFKGNAPFGNITFGNITVNGGSNMTAEELQYRFAEAVRQELRALGR